MRFSQFGKIWLAGTYGDYLVPPIIIGENSVTEYVDIYFQTFISNS